jgi:hypothetical protein
MSCHVFVDEIIHDGFPEDVTGIISNMWNVQMFAQGACILQVFGIVLFLVKAESDTGHFISCVLQ